MGISQAVGGKDGRPHYVVAVAAVVWQDDRMLALRRSANQHGAGEWSVITGALEPTEQPIEAIAREIDEETGLVVQLDPAPVTAYLGDLRGTGMVVVVYQAHHLGGEVTLNPENDAFTWLTPQEFEAACRWPLLVQAVYESSRRRER